MDALAYPLEVLGKIAAAVAFGGMVGWQREAHDRPAGLRTHILVCVGSAVYTLASLSFTGPTADPGRIAAQVATGMGFLGAGTIIRHGATVRGLTTAASLWAIAAVGICIGIGGELLWVAALTTLVVLITLSLLRRAEQRLLARAHLGEVTLRLRGGPERIAEVQRLLADQGAVLRFIEIADPTPDGVRHLRVGVRVCAGADLADLCAHLSELPGCVEVRTG